MTAARRLPRHTKIVCTIGPATNSPGMMERLLKAGMNVARLNLSYGSHQEHERTIARLREVSRRLAIPVAVLMDLPGPKYRIGRLRDGKVHLRKGALVRLTVRDLEGDAGQLPVNLPTLIKDVRSGDMVLLDDGALQLRAEKVEAHEVQCKVVVGGTLLSGKGVVVPGMRVSTPFLNEALHDHLMFATAQHPDYIALSFVTSASEVLQVKDILRQTESNIPVISKIERGQAVDNFGDILLASDGIMVARGDLGVDIPLARVPMVQKEIIKQCGRLGRPVITATQMLESMVRAPLPTRAEVTDVANAIFDGTDAVMLSAETTIGDYPVEAVRMMARIALEAEAHLPYNQLLLSRAECLEPETGEAISYNACRTALQLKAAAIVAFTHSGATAQRVSRYRPRAPVLALTPEDTVRRRLLLYWGVCPVQIAEPSSTDGLFELGERLAEESGLARKGDLIVITGGIPVGAPGSTNLLKVERVK